MDSIESRGLRELEVATNEDLCDLDGHPGHRTLDVLKDRGIASVKVRTAGPQGVESLTPRPLTALFLALTPHCPCLLVDRSLLGELMARRLRALLPATLPAGDASTLLSQGDDGLQAWVDQSRVDPQATHERTGPQIRGDAGRSGLLRRDSAQHDGAVQLRR
jgi:hypothetical protein